MTALDCLTCRTHYELGDVDRDAALAAAKKHRCLGRPYPLRVIATAPAQPAVPTPASLPKRLNHPVRPVPQIPEPIKTAPRESHVVITQQLRSFFEDVEWFAAAGAPLLDIVAAVNVGLPAIRAVYRRCGRVLPDALKEVTPK